MAIKPVEYVKDSSTQGFASAGDQKTITSTNANTIQKDVDQGNTKDLDVSQQKYLDSKVDYDTLDYSDEEMEKVGENQIDTEGEDGEELENKDGKGGAVAAVAAASTAIAGAATAITLSAMGKTFDGFTSLGLSGVALGLGATNLALSLPNVFDSNLGERENQTNNAANNNTIIQNYTDTLSSDMEMMLEDSKMYSELSAGLTQAQVDTITQIGALEAEMQVYQSQGNTAKVAELKAQIEALKQGSEEENKGPQEEMDGLKENIETYTGNNAEASGVKASGDTVSAFLKEGDSMKKMAIACGSLQAVAALACASTIVFPKIWAAFAPVDGVAATIATVMFVAAGLSFSTASGMMFKNADKEGAAVDAGDEMAGYLASLQENIDGQAGFTETTSGVYTETDTAATETVAENQEAADEANGNGPQGANGNGGNKPKPEEPPTGNVA